MNTKFNVKNSALKKQLKYQSYIITTLLALCVLSLSVNIGVVMNMIEPTSGLTKSETKVNTITSDNSPMLNVLNPNITSRLIVTPPASLVRNENTNTTETETIDIDDTTVEATIIDEPEVIAPTETTKIEIKKEESKPVEVESQPVVEETVSVATVTEPIVEENIPTSSFPETELTGNEKLDKEAFTKAVADIAPNLIDTVDALFMNYEKYGLKPSFPLAVACLESGYGKSGLATNKNNLYGMNAYPANGLTAYQHAFTYTSKTESVLDFGERISNYYIGRGLTSLESINARYCPNNSNWASHVRSIKNRIENAYAQYASV